MRKKLKQLLFPSRRFRNEKIFCIGLNKTGTTSIEQTLKELGYRVGNQRKGELLVEEWAQRDFSKIIQLCHSAEAFQDIPFSLPYTFQVLDQHFPNAKFVLTVRDSADQWYRSITQFHSRLWADGERVPTADDLRCAIYIDKGRPYRNNRLIYRTPEEEPYRREDLIEHYHRHLVNVRDYFRHRPGKLIEINIACEDDYFRLCHFLDKEPISEGFPWLNRTKSPAS